MTGWPSGGGEMAGRIRAHDWAATPLGPIEGWPPALRVVVDLLLAHGFPMVILWGPELIQIYNDGYRQILDGRHPRGLGQPTFECWPEISHVVGPILVRARAGETVDLRDTLFRVNRTGHAEDAWFTVTYSPVAGGAGEAAGILLTVFETTETVLAARSLRESQDRQTFLLGLSDTLRSISDPAQIQEEAARALGGHLGLSRVFYAPVERRGEGEVFVVDRDFCARGAARVAGAFPVDGLGSRLRAEIRAGHTAVAGDLASATLPSRAERNIPASLQALAYVSVPLIKGGVLAALMTVHDDAPRAWKASEVALIEEVAERTWAAVERARAETALRESEERFSQFAASSSDALWIRDAATLRMEYVSPAAQTIYGVPPEALLDDPKRWLVLVVPDDRGTALRHIEQARRGEAVTHEFRILRPSDQAFRWIRNTDFPLRDAGGRVQRIGGFAQDVTEAKLAAEHGRVLLHELQHRVRNIMAVIRSVADQTGDTVDDAKEYRDRLHGRLTALARVQTLLTREANAGVDLATLVEAELSAQAAHPGQYAAAGPQLQLAPKAAEVLTLAIYELATNALRYGAFSHPAGRLAVTWSCFSEGAQPWLRLDWAESGAAEPLTPPRRDGFGTTLIRERLPYELNGRGIVDVAPQGLRCRLEFPLRPGDSILETDTVTLSTAISGGSLDMAGEADLNGCTVLVVEDDYYLATDTARALRRAGGAVAGPVGNEADALALIAKAPPRCALVDINLGEGARFAVADALQDAGVPFVFVTGYDDVVIPARFDGIERLRKPVEFRQIVRTAARLCAA